MILTNFISNYRRPSSPRTSWVDQALVIFAAKLGIRQQKFDTGVIKYLGDGIWAKGWQILVELWVNFRVRFFSNIGDILDVYSYICSNALAI